MSHMFDQSVKPAAETLQKWPWLGGSYGLTHFFRTPV